MIDRLDDEMMERFRRTIVVEPTLTRSLVSFQANKARPVYRWYKYKEAFSASLVESLLRRYGILQGALLDPFAGSGTALFAASESGLDADGIELLPIGRRIIETKQIIESDFTPEDFDALRRWASSRTWESSSERDPLPELQMTAGAYPPGTKDAIERYLAECQRVNRRLRAVLMFTLLCVLESVSYTRKDGQYLRWDYRSGRRQGKKRFNKGRIRTLGEAISEKIDEILGDIAPEAGLFPAGSDAPGAIRLFSGSCLDILPRLPDAHYDAVITSPPYCNRYDYTRTYALELALLGIDEKGIALLRQAMLSCTVENRAKDLTGMNPNWTNAVAVADGQPLLQAISAYLDERKSVGALNNSGIPRMVRGYFYESACVIAECARVLKSGAPLLMVNDNVRYAGASVSVDLILSDFAERLGFDVENILILPNSKGNSSQQMGRHGRDVLRKCIYVWRKR